MLLLFKTKLKDTTLLFVDYSLVEVISVDQRVAVGNTVIYPSNSRRPRKNTHPERLSLSSGSATARTPAYARLAKLNIVDLTNQLSRQYLSNQNIGNY